ncbi:hypothetical protein ACLB2K_050751 [Fragaria x ananassa]
MGKTQQIEPSSQEISCLEIEALAEEFEPKPRPNNPDPSPTYDNLLPPSARLPPPSLAKQVKETSVRHWLDQLKDVSYERDDVLDEWNTEILKQQLEEKKEKQGPKAVVTKRKVCFCFGQVHKAISFHKIGTTIKDLNEKLSSIAAEKEDHSFLQSSVRQVDEQLNHDDKRKTSSFVDISMIFGRANEEVNLLSKLSSENSQEGDKVLIIPIVELGWTGMTTLAEVAYNSDEVKFDIKIWVCVSDPFNVIEIAKSIIRGTGKDTPDSNELEDVLQCLSKSIEGKKNV